MVEKNYLVMVICGTSLLANAGRDAINKPKRYPKLAELNEEYEFDVLAKTRPGDKKADSLWDDLANEEKAHRLYDALGSYASNSNSCDEIIALNLLAKYIPRTVNVDMMLVYTETSVLTLVTRTLASVLEKKYNVHLDFLLSFDNPKKPDAGFVELLNDIYSKTEMKRYNKKILLPVGCSKSGFVNAIIAGMMLGLDIYYIHKNPITRAKDLVKLPYKN